MNTKHAIVTGGTKGIGFAIAKGLLGVGYRVLITGRDTARVDAAVTRLSSSLVPGASIEGQVADMRDKAAVERVIAETAASFGGIDVLINNAGVGVFKHVADMTDEDWHRVMDTNLTGVFYATRAVIPHMKRAGNGWIINIASLAGRNYFANGSAYCASKAALVAFSESVMLDVRHDGIRVSCIMPGSVATDFNGPGQHADESWKLTGEDIAEVVLDLLRHPLRSLPSKVEIRPARTRA